MNTGQQLTLLGAISLITGAILPWFSILGMFSDSGMSYGGLISGTIGLLLLFGAFFHKGKFNERYSVIFAVLALIAGVVPIGAVIKVGSNNFLAFFLPSAEAGIFVTFVGAIISFVGGLYKVPYLSREMQFTGDELFICSNCGFEQIQNNSFCEKCGYSNEETLVLVKERHERNKYRIFFYPLLMVWICPVILGFFFIKKGMYLELSEAITQGPVFVLADITGWIRFGDLEAQEMFFFDEEFPRVPFSVGAYWIIWLLTSFAFELKIRAKDFKDDVKHLRRLYLFTIFHSILFYIGVITYHYAENTYNVFAYDVELYWTLFVISYIFLFALA